MVEVRRKNKEGVNIEKKIDITTSNELTLLFLSIDDLDVRRAAVWAVGDMGSAAKILVPQLRQLLKDENSLVREEVVLTVVKMGSEAQKQIKLGVAEARV